MNQFSDAALLRGNYSHMAVKLRAGNRTAPADSDWGDAANDTPAEEAAQDVAKHIFALQESFDQKTQRIEVLANCAIGQMRVLGLVPGEADFIRIDGIMADGQPVATLMHTNQLALTIFAVPIDDKTEEENAAQIGFLIFDELKARKKKRANKLRKLSLSTSRRVKMKPMPAPKKR